MEMKSLSWPVLILGLMGLIGAFVFSTGYRLGAFKDVELYEDTLGSIEFVGRDQIGPYHKTAETLLEIEAWMKTKGYQCKQTVGVFLDDPRLQAEDRLRSQAGCIVDPSDRAKIETDPELADSSEKKSWKLLSSPKLRRELHAKFRGAPSLGPLKVYPKAEDFAAKLGLTTGWPTLEIYTVESATSVVTEYIFPLKSPQSQN